jgi:hypothetical protein
MFSCTTSGPTALMTFCLLRRGAARSAADRYAWQQSGDRQLQGTDREDLPQTTERSRHPARKRSAQGADPPSRWTPMSLGFRQARAAPSGSTWRAGQADPGPAASGPAAAAQNHPACPGLDSACASRHHWIICGECPQLLFVLGLYHAKAHEPVRHVGTEGACSVCRRAPGDAPGAGLCGPQAAAVEESAQ